MKDPWPSHKVQLFPKGGSDYCEKPHGEKGEWQWKGTTP
jgi:hypothetical protein